MSYILDFFKWLNKTLSYSALFLVSPFGAIATVVTAATAFFGSLFSRLSIFEGLAGWVNELTQSLSIILQNNIDGLGQLLLYGFGIDRLVQIATACVALSFGVTVLVFITVFLAVFSLVPLCLIVRATLKAIQVFSLGFIHP